MTNINKEELEKIFKEIRSKTESDSVIISTSNKAVIRKLEIMFANRPDVEIIELSDHLVGRENNDVCYILPENKQIKIIYNKNKYNERKYKDTVTVYKKQALANWDGVIEGGK